MLGRMAEWRLDKFNAQDLANTAWALAMIGQHDAQIFIAVARTAERHLGEFHAAELANTAWAFAMSSEPAPTLLDPTLVLDTLKVEAKPYEPQLQARCTDSCTGAYVGSRRNHRSCMPERTC